MTHNIAWGVKLGLIAALGFSAFVCIEYLILGPTLVVQVGISLRMLIFMYFSAGILGGMVLGIGRPLGKTHGGAIVLGVLVAAVVYGLGCISIFGLPYRWHQKEWVTAIALSIIAGAVGGDRFYNRYS